MSTTAENTNTTAPPPPPPPPFPSSSFSMGVTQLFDKEGGSSTYTYILYCKETLEGIIVDPVDVQVQRDIEVVKSLGITKILYGVNTHMHADHITGTGLLKQQKNNNNNQQHQQQQNNTNNTNNNTNNNAAAASTIFATMQSMISKASTAKADIYIGHGDTIKFGKRFVTVRATPGHTDGCLSFVADDESFVLAGDALLIGGCGRTDFQQGSATELYKSVHTQLFSLPPTCVVCPAHDYKGNTHSTVAEQMATNPRLAKTTVDEFVKIMADVCASLPYPKKIDTALPANIVCGVLLATEEEEKK